MKTNKLEKRLQWIRFPIGYSMNGFLEKILYNRVDQTTNIEKIIRIPIFYRAYKNLLNQRSPNVPTPISWSSNQGEDGDRLTLSTRYCNFLQTAIIKQRPQNVTKT